MIYVRHAFALLAAIFAMTGLATSPVAAQQVVVVVNGSPITEMDVANRSKLAVLSTRKPAVRKEIIDELIDEKLKISFARRYRLEATDSEVENLYNEMAHRMQRTSDTLSKLLTSQGVDPYTLKDKIRADVVWQQIVRGKFQSSFQPNEKEVASALEARKKEDKVKSGQQYTLRPILFVVARNSGEGVVESRKRDAETLRARFENCDTGIAFARGLRDAIVRPPITKTSADLAPALRELLDKTPVGKLTEPEVTPQGVELFALCEKKEVALDDAAKRQIQTEKFSETFQANSNRLLKTLRTGAMIEYKEQPKEEPHAKRAGRNAR